MENWGLCTFGETALLVHPTDGSQAGKQYVALLVAHEIAHQWFGNIVTMEWWTDLWLNEGYASYMEYFCVAALFPSWRMWQQYEGEKKYVVLADLTVNLWDLGSVLKHPSEVYAKFTAWLCALYRPALARIGWDPLPDEAHLDSLLRGRLISALVGWGDVETAKECCRRFHRFIAGEESEKRAAHTQATALTASSPTTAPTSLLPPDIREGVYTAAVSFGGVLGYEMMRERYLSLVASGGVREEQVRCLNALAATPNKSLLTATLDWAIDHPSLVRVEDCCGLIVNVAYNPVGAHACWEVLKRRWEEIVELFEGAFCLPRIVALGGQFASEQATADFSAFMKKHRAPTAERAVKQTIERMQSNNKWMQRDEKNIA